VSELILEPAIQPLGAEASQLRTRKPSTLRVVGVHGGVAAIEVLLFAAARALASHGLLAGLLSALCGASAILLIGSMVEWWVHGKLMHRRSRLPWLHLAYDLHHRAHHWTHYRPDAYLQDEVTYVPLVPPRPERACQTSGEVFAAALGQALFYASALGPSVAVAWFLSGNVAFAGAFSAVAVTIVALAVHLHDAVHCPGHSPLERFGWFWWLDHHHYIHHIDTRVNVNFLLPLGDLLLGTLRQEMTDPERARWPSYEQARAVVHPSCARQPRQ
jgi:hypothetical protein